MLDLLPSTVQQLSLRNDVLRVIIVALRHLIERDLAPAMMNCFTGHEINEQKKNFLQKLRKYWKGLRKKACRWGCGCNLCVIILLEHKNTPLPNADYRLANSSYFGLTYQAPIPTQTTKLNLNKNPAPKWELSRKKKTGQHQKWTSCSGGLSKRVGVWVID